MSYNPSLHTVINKPLGFGQDIPADARSYFYDEVNFKYRPYVSLQEALDYLDTPTKRRGNFPIYINSTGTLADGVITDGEIEEYWFETDITDVGLKLRQEKVAILLDALADALTAISLSTDQSSTAVAMANAAIAIADQTLEINNIITEMVTILEGKVDKVTGSRLISEVEYQNIISRLEALEV